LEFRDKHSCEIALQWILINWKNMIGERQMIEIIFLNLERAFEIDDRKILIKKKMQKYGIKDLVLEWFKSYLENKTQRVKFKGILSKPIHINMDIPQGSVLGPLLFLLYINDITEMINNNCSIRLFLDDALMYTTGYSRREINDKLNKQMIRVDE